ncbi:lonely Cys domain-containing protein [Streptomyces sp. NPDC057418]|uniref:lonely Cys domain-containing protein n=1 Tax=Streptomyces sp. NPDC057418 TaxID=3346126 RepID=UPI0036CDDB87
MVEEDGTGQDVSTGRVSSSADVVSPVVEGAPLLSVQDAASVPLPPSPTADDLPGVVVEEDGTGQDVSTGRVSSSADVVSPVVEGAPLLSVQDAASVPLPPSPTADDLPGLLGEEEAYELSTLSGRPHPSRSEAEALAQFRFTDDTSDSGSDSDDGTPGTAHEAWLDLLFGPAARHDYSPEMLVGTAASLRELAQGNPEPSSAATGARDALHQLTRRVLNLGPDAAVSERHLLLLGSLALGASPADLADEDALASYLRRHDAALDRRTALVSENGTVRNWTGTGDQVPPLDSYAVEGEDGRVSTWPAPWSDPYVVFAQESGDSVLLNTPRGTLALDDLGEFARLVARDPARPASADLVLAFPHQDIADLAQHVADLTGVRVWYSEHAPRPSTDWRTGTDRITSGPVGDGVGRVWTSIEPSQDAPVAGEFDDIIGLYEDDSDAGSHNGDALAARTPDPLTTTDYGVVDDSGEGVLFRKPGGHRGAWQTPRALTGTEGAPEIAMSAQEYNQTLVDERPALRISPDRTLAVEDGAYGQQVFATPEAVASASVKLSRAGLAVRLRTDEDLSIILPTPDGGSKRLFRVAPVFLTRSGRSTEDICRDFADMLADNSRTSHMVFRAPGGGPVVTAPVNASDGAEVTGTHHLADTLSRVADGDIRPESADPGWAASLVRQDDRPAGGHGGLLPGRAYGSALSLDQQDDPRRDAVSEAARRIGINEHAWADIGEGYVVQSVAAAGDQGQPSLEQNYAKPQSAAGGAHFGYHFVTVVLASEDGSHQISLENHARASVTTHRHRRAVRANLDTLQLDELRENAARLRQEIERREEAGDDEHLAELRGHRDLTLALIRAHQARTEMLAAPAGSPERAAAERTLEGATRAAALRVGQLEAVIPSKHQWYMRMYAQRPGESPHDTNVELLGDRPAAVANPLTAVVLRGQLALPVSVSFAKDAQQTPETAKHPVRHLAKVVARTALWNVANGLPLPDVRISGLRSTRLLGRDLTRTRTEAVAASFRQELAGALAEFQEGTPQPHLTADLFTVEPVSVRGRRPSTGDGGTATVDITVDDHRGGPRQIATRGPRGGSLPGGLRGGSPDDGLDPVAEQWPIGRPVTVMRPRYGVDPRSTVPVTDVPVTDVPATDVPADTGKGKAAAVGTADEAPATTGPQPNRWFDYTRSAESRSEPFRYEVADTGHIRLPGGQEIPPTGWTRFGHDFVHAGTGALLRGDSGWIGRVANMDTLALVMADLDQESAPHRIVADPSALYLVPEGDGDTALRIPLRETTGAATEAESGPQPRARLDDRPRIVVRSAFDVRRFTHGGETVTDLTVRLTLRRGEGQTDTDAVMTRVLQGVEAFYNRPGHQLPNGDRLHVTVESVGPDENPHLTVDLVGRDQRMNQRAWWADADPVEFAHELAHQLFLRDETRDESNPDRLDAPGSLLGPFREQAPDGLAQSGLRPRHLQLWAAVAGDIEPHTPPEGTSWADARKNATAELREPAWVDPVSLPAASPRTGPDGAVPPPLPPGRDLSPPAEESDSDDEDESPLWAEPGWLDMLFGPHRATVPRTRLRETSEALYDLVRAEAGSHRTSQALRNGLIRVTRQVLHMGGGARPGPADFLLLGSLALDASSDDVASADDLALYFVERQIETGRGALDEGTLLRDDEGNATGRDFTGPGQPTPELESYAVRGRGRVVPRPAPWQNPYLVVAEAAGRAVEIAIQGRTFRVDSADELAMLISYDSRRPRGADIVLALPPRYAATVASLVAGTTGRRVWYPEAPVGVATHPTTGTRHLMLDLGEGDTGAGWASTDPTADAGLPGARDLSSESDTDSDDDRSSSDGDAEFDRLADQAVLERQIEARRPRPLTTRDYGVIDKRGTGILFTRPLPRSVGEVRAGTGPDALVLPRQDHGNIPMADRPPLHISEDRTLAMLAADDGAAGRSRQVYATRAAIERSSARLAAAGAGIRLKADESTGVMLPKEDGAYGEPLFRVEPEFLTASGGSEHAFTRDFAQMVAGAATAPLSHIAFRGPTGGVVSTAPVNGQHGREVTGTHHLAQALAEVAEGTRSATDVTPRWAARQTGRDNRYTGGVVGAPTPGERYGRALSFEPRDNPLRTPLASAARRIGVNEYAWAGVGEGYLIQSVSTTNDSGAQLFTHNHAKPGDPVGPHAPYHFAQVVLASEDGTHQITLENETHSRSEIPAELLDGVIDENLDRYGEDELTRLAGEAEQRVAEARHRAADEGETDRLQGFARVARALAEVHQAEQLPWYFDEDRTEHALALREAARARSRAKELIRAAAPVMESKDLWSFRAYSKRPGESAHEVNAALLSESSPAVANPLTTVVLHGHAPRRYQQTIRFEEGERGIPADADGTIDGLALSLARAGLWNRAHGLPMPSVTLTGHGNRSQASGQERADAVAKALAARLTQVLDTFQTGLSGSRVGVRDFGLTKSAKRVRSATDPAQGRVVTIGIDDHRLVPPGPSGRATPVEEPSRREEPAPTRPSTTEPVVPPSATTESVPATGRARSRPPGRSAEASPERRNGEAPPWVLARIRYAEESAAFDKRLGEYLAEHEAVTAEFRKMASAAWAQARQRYPRALATFGDTSKFKAGVVGTSREALQRVVRSGNLRELVAFLYEGISRDLVPEMLGGAEEQHPEIAEERPSRRQREAYTAYMRRATEIQASDMSPAQKQAALKELPQPVADPAQPDEARPPLSEAERRFAVDEAGLTWMPATSVYDIAMSAGFQGRSEDSGGLVATGTAGSTYRFMLHAARMREQWGVDLDLGLIRAGMMAISLTVGHHTVHEVMRGAQLALNDVPGHDPALDYTDNWGRYWNIHPLDEQELRENVARDGLFPDEHAQALLDELQPKSSTDTGTGGTGTRATLTHRPIHTRPVASEPNHPVAQMPGPPAAHQGTAATPQEVPAHEAEAHREAVLDALYGLGALNGVDRERAAAALERLDRLRAGDPELRGGFLDLDALVRRVLLLDPSDTVTPSARGALVRLVTAPFTAGAGSPAALSAHYLAQRGAFHQDFRLTDAQGRPRGWNWLGRPLPADFDPGSTGRISRAPDGTTGHSGPEAAPWRPTPGHPEPYLVLLAGRSEGVVVRGLGGFARPVPPEVLHELMALDRNLAGRPGPLLLHVDRPAAASLHLPRGLSDRLGREVWATTGRSVIGRLPNTPDRSVVLLLDEEKLAPRGQWFANTPATAPTPPAGAEGDRVSALSIAHHGHRSTGYISMDLAGSDDGGWSRTLAHSRLGAVTSYVFQRTAYEAKGATSLVPWVERGLPAPYFPNNHGLPGTVMWHTPEGERRDDGPRFARSLARRRSLASLAPEHPVVLLVCYAATPAGIGEMHGLHIDGPLPFVPDPLAAVAVGQDTANETGRTVFATVLMNATVQPRHGDQEPYISLYTDARGRAYHWVEFRPEPAGHALDGRARDAGLHHGPGPATEAVRERALRLVRALRQIFGPTADESPEYPVLLRGMGALDLMREADPQLDRDGAREFTLDLYEQLLTRYHGLPPGQTPQFTPDGHRSLLTDAARLWDSGHRGPLTGWIGLPHLVHMLTDLASAPHREGIARQVLGLDAMAPVGEAEWSRLLWASFKVATVTAQADPGTFAAAVLHLTGPDPARIGEAVLVARRAAAAGRDPRLLHEVAAHHLEQQGALESDRLLTDDEGTAWGRALDGTPRPEGEFDPSVVTLLGYAPDGSLVPVGTEPAPWAADPHRPTPFVYVADGDADGLYVQGPVPPREFGELVFRDPELLGENGYAEVIAVVPHGRPSGARPVEASIPGEGARNSARNWWATHGATTLHHDPATGTYTVAMLPGPDGRPATAGTWGRTTPPEGDRSSTPGPAAATNAPARRTAVASGTAPPAEAATAGLDAAWAAHARALTALGEATADAAATERDGGDATAAADTRAGADEARRALEEAEARLWALGVAPDTLAAARITGESAAGGRGDGSDTGEAAPVVPRRAHERLWIAGQLLDGDLPPAPPRPAGDETVGSQELEAAGITLSVGQRTEMALRGDGRLPASALSPLDAVRAGMAGRGAWSDTMDMAAANASRRLWARAYADFAGAAAEGTDETGTTRAWDTAVSLVLPAEPHAALADSRYAGDGYRDAVRRVADHLLGAGTGPGTAPASAAQLADTLRSGLGLRQRWTAPATDTVPMAQSGTGADMPDFDMSVLDVLDPDSDTFGDIDMSAMDVPAPDDDGSGDIDMSVLDVLAPDGGGLDDIDMSVLDVLGPHADGFGDIDTSAWDGIDAGGFDFELPGTGLADLYLTGPDAPDLDMADADTTGPDMTVLDAGGQPVFAAPTASAPARPLAPLPRLSLVTYGQGETRPSADAQESLERLAFQVARAGLRNRRTRVPLPKIDIAGYGADARQAGTAQERERAARQRGDQRARTAHELFVQKLGHALDTLQENLPADRTRLSARDFKITSRGRARMPGQGYTAGLPGPVSRADLGRQATVTLTSPGHAAAVEALDALRREDRALRAGAFDVDAVARRVLHLDPVVPVGPETRRELYTMVERALAAGRAASLAALSASALEEAGVLAADRAQYVSVGGSRVPGLNWAGPEVVEFDGIFVEHLKPDQAGGFIPTGLPDFSPWPWDVTPYAVLADGRHDRVVTRLPDGTTRELDVDTFVELVAADPARQGLPDGTPIVLAVPFAGDRYLELPRKLAERTGHTVWVHSGLARRHPDPAGQSTIAVIRQDGLPHGSWVAVRPGLAPDAEDGAPDWHRDVLTQPIVSTLTGQQIGRSLHEPGELTGTREDNFSLLDRMTLFVHFNRSTGTYSAKLPLVDPGPKDKAYHLAGHGLPGRLVLPLAGGGSRAADGHEAGDWLRRRKSLSSLPEDHWIDMVVCYSSTPQDTAVQDLSQAGDSFRVPFAADPLADDALSMGQHLANATGRTVRLSYDQQGAFSYQDDPVRVLFTDARGRRWWWETSRPEPGDAELDRLAQRAGFDTAPSPRTRAELLRVVRALKAVFGPDVEDAADYAALVRGTAALVNMWHTDPDLGPTGPFSPDLLRRVVAAHPEAVSGVDRQVTRRVLAAAAQAWQSEPSLPVSRFVGLPVLHSAARWLQDTAAVDEAAVAALALSGPGDVGTAERARLFRARVKAEETRDAAGPDADALMARLRHLDPGTEVDDALRGEALTLLTRGFAAGRNMTDPDVAAAYDLEARGAFDRSAAPTTMGPATGGGRDWKDGSVLPSELSRFRTPDGLADAPWAGQDANGKDRPVPYPVLTYVDFQNSDRLHVGFGGASYAVSAEEFAELLAADAQLSRKSVTTPVLLLATGLGGPAPGLADVIAQRLGRSVWWSPFPANLSGTDDSGTAVPTLVDSLVSMSSPTAGDWYEARPVDPPGTQEGPRPVEPPLPAGPRPGTVGTAGDAARGTGTTPAPVPTVPVTPPAAALDADWAFTTATDASFAPASPVSSPATSETWSTASPPSAGHVGTGSDPLLSGATLMTDGRGTPRGRDWTGFGIRSVDASRMLLHEQRDGELRRVSQEAAPWGAGAYVVAADGGYESLFAAGRELGPRAVADLLAADPALVSLPRDVPVVLVSPYAGAQDGQLARAVAERLGRRVWAPSGDGRLLSPADEATADVPAGALTHVPSLVDSDPEDAYGDWVPFDPPPDGSGRSVDREWVTVDGVRFRDSDVDTRPLVGADHRFEGRESMPDDGRRRLRERRLRLYRGMRERAHVLRLGDTYHTVDAEETAPDPEASVYTFHAHGVPGGLKLVHKDGRVLLLGAEDGGRYIGGLPEVVARAAGEELHVASCYGAVAGDPVREQSLIRPAPLVEDPLEEVALAQHTANHSGRTTTAATGRTGYNDTVRLLAATPDGTLASIETFLPEPVDGTAELTEAAGLRPLPRPTGLPAWDHEGPRALRLVRALRQVFGNEVEADRGVPGGRYERLLRGIGALETLRANDPALSALTPLRMELWQVLAQTPDGPDPRPADYEAVLDRALAADPDSALTAVWDAPALRAALDRLATGGDAAVLAVLRMPTGPLTPRAYARALWAMTGASRLLDAKPAPEREEWGRTALHLPAGAPWDASAEARLRELTEQAVAAGRDSGHAGELAVFHLETLGAFADQGRIRTPGGALQGRNWGPTPTPGGLEPSRLYVARTGADADTTTLEFAPWTQEGAAAPYFVHAETDTAGAVLLRLPGGTVQVGVREFFALLESDPELSLISRHRPVALLVPGIGTGQRRALQRFSRRNDRTVWSYDGAFTVSGGSAARPGHVTALPQQDGRPQPEPETGPGTDSRAPDTRTTATAQASDARRPGVWRRTVPRIPSAAETDTVNAASGDARVNPATTAEWNASTDADGVTPAGGTLPYSADGQFDERFAATLEAFPVAASTDRHTVWGYGQADPDFHVFVAEIPALGLRGEYNPDGPSAGGVTDMTGQVHSSGPAWDWYLPGRGLVASSRMLTDPPTGDEPVPVGWPATGPVRPTPPVDPATTAADPAALAGGTLPEALWRDHDGPLYRFSPDGPEQVFAEGLKPYGSDMVHIVDHVYGGSALVPHTVFASATANRDYVRDSARANPMGAPALYRRYRWRYDVQVPGGIDVNATLGLASPFPDQEEVLFPGGVDRRYIRGAQPMAYGIPLGPYVANPHFTPLASPTGSGGTSVVDADFAGPAEPAAGPVLESFPALSLDSDSDSDDDPRPLLSRYDDSDPDDDPAPLPARGREPSTDREVTPVPGDSRRAADPDDSSEPAEETGDPAAPDWVLARVRYAQEALYFEQRLAAYLGENEQVNAEFGKVVRSLWLIALHHRTDYRMFGSDSGEDGGAVGTSYENLARVVESGNLRERVTFLFNGVARQLVPYLLGGVEPPHPVISLERRDRHTSERLKRYEQERAELLAAELDPEDEAQEMEELDAMLRTPLLPHEVSPVLSPAERRLAVREGALLWSPAGLVHTLPMSADFQARSEDSAGLVLTGTSGSAYRILTHVARLPRLAGVPVDLGLIRTGLLSVLVGVGHHSFHEVMTGAQHALDEIDRTAASVYADNWGRYWDVHPLSEEELRAFVAREGLFPDEHARALLAELEAGRGGEAGKAAGTGAGNDGGAHG